MLDRLLELNHDRYAEEVRQGLHSGRRGAGRSAKRSSATSPTIPSQPTTAEVDDALIPPPDALF